MNTSAPRLLVTVGTDFHPFDRVVHWVDSWLDQHPHLADQVLVQHGRSRPSRHAVNADLLSYPDLQRAMRGAEAVISHGGPATIFEARRHGHVPLCTARRPAAGEHVDDHQERFVRYLDNAGLVRGIDTEADLHHELELRLVQGMGDGRTGPSVTTAPAGAQALSRTVAEVVTASRDRRRPGLLGHVAEVRHLARHRRRARRAGTPTRLAVKREPQSLVHEDLPVVGYVILSHQPDQRLERLVTRIRQLDPDARIHVNHNPTGASAITAEVVKAADSIVLTPGGRADATALRRLLHSSEIALEDPDVAFVMVISGEDYPCDSLLSVRRELAGTVDGFLNRVPALDPAQSPWPRREAHTRYFFRWRTLFRHGQRLGSLLHPLHAVNFVQPLVRFNTVYGGLRVGLWGNPPPAGLRLHAGSAWWALSRRAVESVSAALREGTPVARWTERLIVADEAVIPSVIASSPDLDVTNARKFYADFSQTTHGRPAYLTTAHLPDILNSRPWFCRKVADAGLMDELDRITDERSAEAIAVDASVPPARGDASGA